MKKKIILVLLLLIGIIGFYGIVEFYKFNHSSLNHYISLTEERSGKEGVKIRYDKMDLNNCILSDLYLIKEDGTEGSQIRFRYLVFNLKIDVFQNTEFIVKNSNNEVIDYVVGCFTQEFFRIKSLSIILSFHKDTYIPYPDEEIQVEIYTKSDKWNTSKGKLVAHCIIKFSFTIE